MDLRTAYGGAVLREGLQLGIEGSIVLLRMLRHRPPAETELEMGMGTGKRSSNWPERAAKDEGSPASERLQRRLTVLLGLRVSKNLAKCRTFSARCSGVDGEHGAWSMEQATQ